MKINAQLNKRQQEVAKRYLSDRDIFPFGKEKLDLKIKYDNSFHVEYSLTSGNNGTYSGDTLLQNWTRFWGDRSDGAPTFFSTRNISYGTTQNETPLCFENEIPKLSRAFIQTLDIGLSTAQKANTIILEYFNKYLKLESQNIVLVKKHSKTSWDIKVNEFASKRDSLLSDLWEDLETIFNDRQMAIIQRSIGSKYGLSDQKIMPYGYVEYDMQLSKNNHRVNATYRYKTFFKGSGSGSTTYTKNSPNYIIKRLLDKVN